MTGKRFIHRRKQVGIHGYLHHVAQSPRGLTSFQDVRVFMHGEKYDLGPAASPRQFLSCLNPAHYRHRDV